MPARAAASAVSGTALASDMFAAVRPVLDEIESCIALELGEGGGLVGALGTHLLGGGKRLRPALVVQAGLAAGGEAQRLVPVAAACEIIHMATLVHDDLIDDADRRRGVPTVHVKWGVPTSVLLGDRLFAKGFSMLAATGDPIVVRLMSEVVSQTCAGEIEEIEAQWDAETTVEAYYRRIRAKTGVFITECCRMGAVVAGAAPAVEQALAAYGEAVGDCFQLVDDLLDLTASESVLGKPTGSDLRAGVFTLPVLLALRGPRGADLRRLLAARPLGDPAVAQIVELLGSTGTLREAAGTAVGLARRAQEALASLPDSPQRRALWALAAELSHRVA